MIGKNILLNLLWSTIEDFVGLWEINWELNNFISENNNNENRLISKEIVNYFLVNGLINLYYGKWGDEDINEVPYKEAKSLLNEDKYWEPPMVGDTCIKLGITEKGELIYTERRMSDLVI